MSRTESRAAFVRRFVVACVVIAVVFPVMVAVGDRYGRGEFAKRKTVNIADGLLAPQVPAKPANFLMIGHDAFGNSDTMMVAHIDPAVRIPLLVSFPRDLMVTVPGHGFEQLNAAFPQGGPTLLIQTLESNFHFPIQHYLQVDFDAFPKIVDAIGHVRVWFPTPVHDPFIGLNVAQRGCVSLDGTTALAYVRSRHYYVPDDPAAPAAWSWDYPAQQGGQGWTATGSDIDRIPRQQYFLRTLAQTALRRTSDNPLRIVGLVDAVMTHLTTDQSLTLDDLKALVRTFRRLKPVEITMTTLPWAPDPANPNRLVVKYPEATGVIGELANFIAPLKDIPKLVAPRTVSIRVENGSGVTGIAHQVQDSLVHAGFRAPGPAVDASRSDYARTEVRWTPGHRLAGVTVVFGTGAVRSGPISAADAGGADVVVIVGRDWGTLQHHLGELPGAPSTRTVGPGSPHPSGSTTTTTTFDRRFVPVDPKTGGTLVGCPK